MPDNPCSNPIVIVRNPSLPQDIDISVTGGVPPYIYSWATGDHTQDLQNRLPGLYCVTVTDANECSQMNCYVITATRPCGIPILQRPYAVNQANITLNWIPMYGVDAYQITWREYGANRWNSINVINGNIASFVIQNLRRGRVYSVRVKARCGMVWSNWASDVVTTSN